MAFWNWQQQGQRPVQEGTESFTPQLLQKLCSVVAGVAQNPADLADDKKANEVISVLQRIGEMLVWGVNVQGDMSPLVDAFITASPPPLPNLRELLMKTHMSRLKSRIDCQLLQTTHVIVQNAPPESALFNYLLSGWFLNKVVAHSFEFSDEDVMATFITTVNDIAKKLNEQNFPLFFDQSSSNSFPLFSEAVKFFHHPNEQIRANVISTTLYIFDQLRPGMKPAPEYVRHIAQQSNTCFTHVACLCRDLWVVIDNDVKAGKSVRQQLSLQTDLLLYLHDVLAFGIPELNTVLIDRFLVYAILPVLVRSIASSDNRGDAEYMISPALAMVILQDIFERVKHAPLLDAIFVALCDPAVPARVAELCRESAPKVPPSWATMTECWQRGGRPTSAPEITTEPGEQPVHPLDERRGMESNTVRRALFDILDGVGGRREPLTLLTVCTLYTVLTRSENTSFLVQCGLLPTSGPRPDETPLSDAVMSVLRRFEQINSATIQMIVRFALELVIGKEQFVAKSRVKDRVLQYAKGAMKNAALTLQEEANKALSVKPGASPEREKFLESFMVEWAAHLQTPKEPSVMLQDVTGLLQQKDKSDRAKAMRAVLYCRRLQEDLVRDWRQEGVGKAYLKPSKEPLPGLDREAVELTTYRVDETFKLGDANRIRCFIAGSSVDFSFGQLTAEKIPVYMVPTDHLVLLVRPDFDTPQWAIPKLVQTLRDVSIETEPRDARPGCENVLRLQCLGAPGESLRFVDIFFTDPRRLHCAATLLEERRNKVRQQLAGDIKAFADRIPTR
mmetsp:Transcript_131232/g.298794  ORF Transcript_131232/g.298794 Transcript_131232/m.298794 type:complete len:789 (-) Transcript_131232:104-2470(-)